jgi:hypothetical protein
LATDTPPTPGNAPSAPIPPPAGQSERIQTTPAGEAPVVLTEEPTVPIMTNGNPPSTGATIRSALTAIVSAVNPFAGALVGAFSPIVAEKLEKELQRHTDRPEVAAQVVGAMMDAVQSASGQSEPVQAVAAAMKDPAVLQRAETAATDKLDELAPFIDKLAALDEQAWRAEEDSRDAASRRAHDEQHDQDEYLTKSIVKLMIGLLLGGAILTALLALIDVDVQSIVGALLLLAGGVGNEFKGRYAHRYGSSRSSGAKDVLIDRLSQQRSKQ